MVERAGVALGCSCCHYFDLCQSSGIHCSVGFVGEADTVMAGARPGSVEAGAGRRLP